MHRSRNVTLSKLYNTFNKPSTRTANAMENFIVHFFQGFSVYSLVMKRKTQWLDKKLLDKLQESQKLQKNFLYRFFRDKVRNCEEANCN